MGVKLTRLVNSDVIPTKVSQLENDAKYQNEEQVDAKIQQNKQTKETLGLGNVDNTSDLNKPISNATQQALNLKANKNEIPTKTSQLTNDSNFLTEHQSLANYYNKGEVDTKVNAKEDKANLKALAYKDSLSKTDVGLGNVNNVAITQEQVTQIGTNKTNIEKLGVRVSTNETNIANAQSTSNEALSIAKGRARTKVFETYNELTTYLKTASATEFNVGDNLLIRELYVPDYWISKVLGNNSGIYGYYEISILETTKVDLSNYYNKSEIDTKETNLNDKINEKADLSVVYTKSQVDSAFTSRDENISQLQQNKADKTSIPTKTSQLENDSNFLTQHQDLSNYYTKTQVDSELTKINAKNTEQDTSISNALSKAEEALAKANQGGGSTPEQSPQIEINKENIEKLNNTVGEKIYKPVPTKEFVNNIYFNTSLSSDEVINIIETNIPELKNATNSYKTYSIFISERIDDTSRRVTIQKNSDNSYYISSPEKTIFSTKSSYEHLGWQPDFDGVIPINRNYASATPFGKYNDKLTELVSLSSYKTLIDEQSNIREHIGFNSTSIEETNYKFKEYKKILGEFNFPEPVVGKKYVEKIYINTNFTEGELRSYIQENVVFNEFNEYDVFMTYTDETNSNAWLKLYISNSNNMYTITLRDETKTGGDRYTFIYNGSSFVNNVVEINGIYPYTYNDETNKKLTSLFSLTPLFGKKPEFIEDIYKKANSSEVYTKLEIDNKVNQLNIDINKKASLGTDGKVPSSQLPSYVDDVLEYASKSLFPTSGETGKIYVDTTTNITYRWSGSQYVEISASLALGETSSTAYSGAKGKANADAIVSLQSNKADKTELFSKNYNDLTNKPTIPTKTSQLANDSGYLTSHQSLSNYYTKSEIDNKIGDINTILDTLNGEVI